MSGLNLRTRKILYALVTEYISTGEAVGSRTLSRRYGIQLSPATIRSVLQDLEEDGYIQQPHTSAGRLPTDKGFRLFVDALVDLEEVSEGDRHAIRERLEGLRSGGDVMREAGRVLSDLTGAATLVTAPAPEDEPLSELRFLPLRDGELLAILVGKTGTVQNRIVRSASRADRTDLERVNNYLDSLLEGGSLRDLRNRLATEMDRERGTYREVAAKAKEMIEAAVTEVASTAVVVIEGQGRLFDRPEFADVTKLRDYLRAFEEKERLLELLERTLDAGGVRVIIGAEAGLGTLQDISVVSSQYLAAGTGGSVAVVGPTRMDYGKVVPLVEYTARAVASRLGDGSPDGGGGP